MRGKSKRNRFIKIYNLFGVQRSLYLKIRQFPINIANYHLEVKQMSKCINCNKNEGSYEYSEGGYVCDECVKEYFVCPRCGKAFPKESGDAGNGFCEECSKEL